MLKKFGEIYKLFRESRKITLREIEHKGISRSQLSRFEKGETDLTITKFLLAPFARPTVSNNNTSLIILNLLY